jgi:hypothetical protein
LEQLAKTRPDWQEGKPESSAKSPAKALISMALSRHGRTGNSKFHPHKDQGKFKLQGSKLGSHCPPLVPSDLNLPWILEFGV